MFNYEKYRILDTLHLVPLYAEVFKENEQGELIDCVNTFSLRALDMEKKSYFSHKELEGFDIQQWIYDFITTKIQGIDCYQYISICGGNIQVWQQEDEDGAYNERGKYFTLYTWQLKLNSITVVEDDLNELCPNFDW